MASWVASRNRKFLFSADLHDVTFEFPNEDNAIIPAHATVLAFASEVFESELYETTDLVRLFPMTGTEHCTLHICKELKEHKIVIEDALVNDFKVLLRFIYTGEILISTENLFRIGYLAHKYRLTALSAKVADFFSDELSEDVLLNWFRPPEIAYFNTPEKDLMPRLWQMFSDRATEYLQSGDFVHLGKEVVETIVNSESFSFEELDLYKAVAQWANYQCGSSPVTHSALREIVKDFIHNIRMPTITLGELVGEDGIFCNKLLSESEKTLLIRYCGGDMTARVPFMITPREKSLDKIHPAPPTRDADLITSKTTFEFNPHETCRFVGVQCEINVSSKEETPVKIGFEIRSFDATVCRFDWTADYRMEVKNLAVTCMAGDIYPLIENRDYKCIVEPGPGIEMASFTGSFADDNAIILGTEANVHFPISAFVVLHS